jgi:hypothetical protein
MKILKPGKPGNAPPPPALELDEDTGARLFAEALASTDTEEFDDLGYALASEEILAADWFTAQEDDAWIDL